MPTYRHRPTTVEAEPYRPGLEDGLLDGQPYIATSEGPMMIGPGDIIVTGVKGERYPVKPDVFDLVYEVVSEREYRQPTQPVKLVAWKVVDVKSRATYGLHATDADDARWQVSHATGIYMERLAAERWLEKDGAWFDGCPCDVCVELYLQGSVNND